MTPAEVHQAMLGRDARAVMRALDGAQAACDARALVAALRVCGGDPVAFVRLWVMGDDHERADAARCHLEAVVGDAARVSLWLLNAELARLEERIQAMRAEGCEVPRVVAVLAEVAQEFLREAAEVS